MLDLGRSLISAVVREPDALALVDGDLRLSYSEVYRRVSAVIDTLHHLGLKRTDRLLTVLQNNHCAAIVHWACQMMGITIVPVNWRAQSGELDFFVEDSGAKAVVSDSSSVEAVSTCAAALKLPTIGFEAAIPGAVDFSELSIASAPDATPMGEPDDWSVILYTSGTTANPKGVPRRHRAERAAAIAHVAQNLMPYGDRTLGVMPLYHTMGVRSLLAMALLNGTFVCLPRFNPGLAVKLIEREKIGSLYLVPTLYHDILVCDEIADTDLSSAKRLGFAGASMTNRLLQLVQERFKPDLLVNHYGSSEIYTFSVDQKAAAKPGSAGKAGLNQTLRIVEAGSRDPEATVDPGEEGEIIATLTGDEAFEGYWNRPDANEKSLIRGWYFTGDSGSFDTDGDLFVTGRTDDMIITGGENVSPIEVENCISMHPNVYEVAVVGLPDERWGKIIAAFVKRAGEVSEADLDAYCLASGLASFKRPRRYVFVSELPKSPVGKLLRRLLVAGTYEPE